MALEGKNILCVVPARGGSKSIPRKNLATIQGVSLVGHAGKTIGRLTWVDAKVLSTDDADIAVEGNRYGLDTPFLRPEELATDTATSLDMWKHAWLASEEHYGMRFDISLLVEPTSPLRVPEDLERTALCVARDGHPAAVTVSRTPAHFTPQKALIVDDRGNINYYIGSDGLKYHNRQTIPAYYHRNGICYAVSRNYLLIENLILEGARPVIIDRPVVNIDEKIEIELAEWFMSRSGKKEG
jgi:CMP-N-acetylneuraminic acid synthetase